jgi:hypothetical protein
MANILLLFNYTDYAAQPWLDAGHTCLSVDIQHKGTALPRYALKGDHLKVGYDVYSLQRKLRNTPWRNPDFVLSMAPCTDLAVSGARHWKNKAKANPRFQLEALSMARYAEDHYNCPWVLENPVGALTRLWRRPDAGYFHPSDFGGYLPVDDVHPDYPEYIAPRDAYPKKTGLWLGNGALPPVPRKVDREPGWSTQQKKLGGKSLKTKNIRSATPRGMFRAIFEANKDLVT